MSLFGFCLPFEENGVDCVFGRSMHFHSLCSVVKQERQYFHRCLSVRGLPLKGGGLYGRRSAWWDRRDVVNRRSVRMLLEYILVFLLIRPILQRLTTMMGRSC